MKYIITSVLLLISSFVYGTDYFVSGAGNNANSGLTSALPKATLAGVASFITAGNTIYLERGYTYYGSIVILGSNVNINSYGTGTMPVISGLSSVSGWSNISGNIWEASVTGVKAAVNLVLRNNVIQQIGRYPNLNASNGGYLTYTAATTTSITGPALSADTNWTGAEIAIRRKRWDISRRTVTSHSGGVVGFAAISTANTDYGYFFQRDSRTLDQDGEWWYDNTNSKLRVYSTANPATHSYQITTVDTLLKNVGYNSVTITNIAFDGAGYVAIFQQGNSNITVRNCYINNSGAFGVRGYYTTNMVVDSTTVVNSLGAGINLISNTNTQAVTNCTVSRTCLFAGMEISGEGADRAGIRVQGTPTTITNNRVMNSGYLGIEFQGDDVNVKYNLIDSFCSVRDDGGAIYSYEAAGGTLPTRSNRNVISNIMLDGFGNNNGTDESGGSIKHVNGLYFDEGSRTIIADSNTIVNVGRGYHGNNNADLTFRHNIFYNTDKSFSFQRLNVGNVVRGIIMKKNIYYPYRFEYRNLAINLPSVITKEADILAMGTLDSNYYSLRAGTDTSIMAITTYNTYSNYTENYYNFAYLTGTVGIETHSTSVANTGTLQYNASSSPVTYTHTGYSKIEPNGTVHNNSTIIPAWGSKILIENGTTPSNKRFVSGEGNDANDGFTAPTAWATIDKVNSMLAGLASGDSILFERGFTYTGSITVNRSNINFNAYGIGSKPVITGFTILTGWTNEGGGIYSKIITSDDLTNMVTIDGIQYAMGRFPDATYLTFESFSTNVSITDNTLGFGTDWTGAEVWIRKADWKGDRCLITNHTSNTLTYTSYGSTSNPYDVGFGYFIQNDLRTLTTYGEWHHNTGTGKFSMYFGGVDPTSKTVKVATKNYGINAGGYDNLTVANIEFQGSIQSGIYQQGANDNNSITYCNVFYAGKHGIENNGSGSGNIFNYNTIKDVNGYGIYDYSTSTDINHNEISNVGVVLGQYKGSDGYSGIYSPGYNVDIKYNYIHNIGYNGIIFRSLGTGLIADVSYNLIDTVCTLLDDGGGIYTSTADAQTKRINYNIVLNVEGNSDGTPGSTAYSAGIYLDETETNCEVIGNVVAHNPFAGIKLHKAHDNIIRDNIVYDNLYGLNIEDYVGNQVRLNDVKNNIFFAKTGSQYVFRCYTVQNDIPDFFGIADSNYYTRPIDEDFTFRLKSLAINYVDYTLAQWKTLIGDDNNSLTASQTVSSTDSLFFNYNATGSSVVWTFSGKSRKDHKGTVYNNSYTIPAWGGIVLFANGTTTPASGNKIRGYKFRTN